MNTLPLDPRTKRPTGLNTGNPSNMKTPSHYFLPCTGTTPEVTLDKHEGTAFILGRCIAFNPRDFFQPLLNWATSYTQNPQPVTMVIINTDYVNTGSGLALRQFLNILASVQFTGRKLIIKWYCDNDDEDIRELITLISDIISVKIQVEVAE